MDLTFILNEDSAPDGGDLGVQQPIAPPTTERGDRFFPYPLRDPHRPTHIYTLPNTPLGLFQLFLTSEMVDFLVRNTHRRRDQQSRAPADEKKHSHSRDPQAKHSRYGDWPGSHKPPNASEILVFLASLIYMGLHQENRLEDYWNTNPLAPSHPISRFFSRDRWQAVYSSFATFDPDDEGDEAQPRLYARVSTLSEHIQRVSSSLIDLGCKVTIDEAMVRFTGRSKEATVVKGKPTPRGFRVWVCGQNGYFVSWLWHVNNNGPVGIPYPNGKGLARNAPLADTLLAKLNNTQQVVVTLLDRLPRGQYHVFLDNLFTSPALLTYLRTYLDCAATGTARTRSGIDGTLLALKKSDSTRDHVHWNHLEKAPYPGGLVNQFAWKDNSLALFFSTYYTGDEDLVWREHRRPRTRQTGVFWGSDHQKVAPLPEFADEYNLQKGGVDRGDQLRSYNVWDHHIKGSRHGALVLEFLLEVVLVNTYLLQRHFCGPLRWRRYLNQSDWRQALFEAIVTQFAPDSASRQRGCEGTAVPGAVSTTIRHTLIFRGKNSDCAACNGRTLQGPTPSKKRRVLGEISGNSVPRAPPVRKTTQYGCNVCDIALCTSSNCWYKFHGGKA